MEIETVTKGALIMHHPWIIMLQSIETWMISEGISKKWKPKSSAEDNVSKCQNYPFLNNLIKEYRLFFNTFLSGLYL